MRFLSYNVHSWTGADKIKDYRRALDVICERSPDAAALQEVVIPHTADNLEDAHSFIEKYTGMNAIFGQTMLQSDSPYGNVLLTKEYPERYTLHDISIKGFEPRGLIHGEIEFEGGRIALLATHLGLKMNERVQQAKLISGIIKGISTPFVLMCDCNEWFRGRASRILDGCSCRAKRIRSYPSRFPLFALDSIRSSGVELEVRVINEKYIKKISDHLPIEATLI